MASQPSQIPPLPTEYNSNPFLVCRALPTWAHPQLQPYLSLPLPSLT